MNKVIKAKGNVNAWFDYCVVAMLRTFGKGTTIDKSLYSIKDDRTGSSILIEKDEGFVVITMASSTEKDLNDLYEALKRQIDIQEKREDVYQEVMGTKDEKNITAQSNEDSVLGTEAGKSLFDLVEQKSAQNINTGLDIFKPTAKLLTEPEDDGTTAMPEPEIGGHRQKKPFYAKKGFITVAVIACALIIAILAIRTIGQRKRVAEEAELATTVEPTATIEPTVDPNATSSYTGDLTTGNYIVGKDIPAGNYEITVTHGTGNVVSNNATDPLNAVMSNVDESNGALYSTTATLAQGDALGVSGSLILNIKSSDALVNGMVPRGESPNKPVDLTSGEYTAGTDFQAGTYTVIAKGYSGLVSSNNMNDGGLNVTMSTEDDEICTKQFNNAILPAGAVLTVGTDIQLLPVGE